MLNTQEQAGPSVEPITYPGYDKAQRHRQQQQEQTQPLRGQWNFGCGKLYKRGEASKQARRHKANCDGIPKSTKRRKLNDDEQRGQQGQREQFG